MLFRSLSDADEVNIYHTNPLLADTDGDGIGDAQEVAAGTNPLDPKSGFVVVSTQRTVGGGFTLNWSAKAGKTYRVLRSATADFANHDVTATGISAVEPVTTYTDSTVPAGATQMFYKVEVE